MDMLASFAHRKWFAAVGDKFRWLVDIATDLDFAVGAIG
jgi:hypothetical protein